MQNDFCGAIGIGHNKRAAPVNGSGSVELPEVFARVGINAQHEGIASVIHGDDEHIFPKNGGGSHAYHVGDIWVVKCEGTIPEEVSIAVECCNIGAGKESKDALAIGCWGGGSHVGFGMAVGVACSVELSFPKFGTFIGIESHHMKAGFFVVGTGGKKKSATSDNRAG